MSSARRWLWQAAFFAVFFIPLAKLTSTPSYHVHEQGTAVIKLAFRHAGVAIGECETIHGAGIERASVEQLRNSLCSRERSPLELELILDGETLYRELVHPTGLNKDGVASVYARFVVPAGRHEIALAMRDDVVADAPNWILQHEVELAQAEVLVIGFREGFILQ